MTVLPLAFVVTLFKHPAGLVIERTNNTYVDGYLSNNPPTLIPVLNSVIHPLKGRDRLLLAEGDRTKEAVQVISTTRFRTSLEGTNEQADIIRYTPTGESIERRYVVTLAEDWKAQSGHFRILAVRIPDA